MANKNCNDWKLQIHCTKLEWLNPRNHNELENPFYVYSKKLYMEDNNKTMHWVGHAKLKP